MSNDYPRCPVCPTDKDNQIIISKARPECWYCCNCGKYFKDINGRKPNVKSLLELLVMEESPELRWSSEEVLNARDHKLASFYAMLNDGDRCTMIGAHIDIHGDFREIPELVTQANGEDQADGKL